MAITNRTQFKDYCLRRLGFPVIELNLDDDQIEDRIDDAICATRAALEEGILPGGGLAYINFIRGIKADDLVSSVVIRSLFMPAKYIATNAGEDVNEDFIIVNTTNTVGYNAKTDKFEDLKLAGVIDPTKVTRMALENAASIAGMVLLTECLIENVS